jgi:hydroxypyruvate isomerase
MKSTNRREALKNLALGSIALSTAGSLSCAENMNEDFKLKGNVNHSVCQWTYNFLPLDDLCQVVKKNWIQCHRPDRSQGLAYSSEIRYL